MLAIGHSSLWSNDQNRSDISEGPLELELDQGDVPPPGTSDISEGPFEPELGQDDAPPPGTSSTSHRIRNNWSQSPSSKYARLSDKTASPRSDDQDRAKDMRDTNASRPGGYTAAIHA